ncbi:nitroreductase family protein [soil metagenome]
MTQTTANHRTADHPIDPMFLERWSPRAYDSSAVSAEDAATLFEAARWAPSSYNSQPWRYVYAHRDTPQWAKLFGLLNDFNRGWAHTASIVVIAISKKTMMPPGGQPTPSRSHSFDAGAAWMALALQASRMDLHAHGMTGIDFDAAPKVLGLSDDYSVECGIVIGRIGDKASLPEGLRARETPNERQPISAFAFEGDFKP